VVGRPLCRISPNLFPNAIHESELGAIEVQVTLVAAALSSWESRAAAAVGRAPPSGMRLPATTGGQMRVGLSTDRADLSRGGVPDCLSVGGRAH